MNCRLYIQTLIILFLSPLCRALPQNCNNWAKFSGQDPGVQIGDLDIPGNKITVEALFNRIGFLRIQVFTAATLFPNIQILQM